MVNYKRVVCEVAVLVAVASLTVGAPAPDCTHAHTHIDQRQNGSENYRLNIDGVVIAIAPAETFIEAASDLSDLFEQSDFEYLLTKPPSEHPSTPESLTPDDPIPLKPEDEKPLDKPIEKPVSDASPSSDLPIQKKDASVKKQEKVKRLKNRLANLLIPLLRKTRQH